MMKNENHNADRISSSEMAQRFILKTIPFCFLILFVIISIYLTLCVKQIHAQESKFPIIDIFLGGLKKERLISNDMLAQSTLMLISTACETFTAVNKGNYPAEVADLINAQPPYLDENFCGQTSGGYSYTCRFSTEAYTIIAAPVEVGKTGSAIFKIVTGGILSSRKQ